MPHMCFSYSSGLPPGSGNRGPAGQVPPGLRRMKTTTSCFSYSADGLPRDLRRMPVGPCFSYSADGLPRDLRRMPGVCFSYQAGDLRRMPEACFSYQAGDLRRMPVFACFSYPADLPPGVRKRNSAP